MAVPVILPKVGITVESCIIGTWNKRVGDRVAVGDVLFSYETDKAVFDCESTAEGTILQIYHGDGDEVAVLSPVCAVGAPGETLESGAPDEMCDPPPIGVKGDPPASDIKGGAYKAAPSTGGGIPNIGGAAVRISPRARNLANRIGIDYGAAIPSGPGGRVIERDIELLAANRLSGSTDFTEAPRGSAALPPASAAPRVLASALSAVNAGAPEIEPLFTDVKMPKIRRVIAETMIKSLSELAQLTHHHSFDATKLLALRDDFKKYGAKYGLDGVTVGDIILFTVSRVLRETPDFNAHLLEGNVLRKFRGVNLGVATATERGLLVPTVFGADKMSLKQVSAEVKSLAAEAKAGSIDPDKLSGATFTVSNLGAAGVEMFTPIINPPQVAILGVCGIVTRVRAAAGAGIEAYPSMGLSLTYDHRAVDGAPASAFAQKICETLERVNLLLAGEL